ncbi:MAG TPA: hypothetical protein VNW04_01430 [Puia sp.]|jgi:hypothetical protein|nr:hypothetical protein [Puia sp.]
MKRLCLLLVTLAPAFFSSSCKKYIQKQEQNAAESIITNGYWYVSGYKQNDSDITAAFSGYLFKFDANNTVTGTKGNSSASGQWSDNIVNRTITANFPGAAAPLVYLNEVWTIKDSYSDSVSATSADTINHTTNILQLKKQ